MRKTEFDGVSPEDLEHFRELLMDFYGCSWEDSFLQLTREIQKRILNRDTNARYRSYFDTNLNDLVMSVVSRFMKINAKLRAEGQKIHNFYAMLEDRIGHVHFEELRKLARLTNIDDLDVASETSSPAKHLELNELRAIKVGCYKKCLDDLPSHISKIFAEYYDLDELSPTERTQARQRLALRQANLSPSEATPGQVKRAKNNLEKLICQWRKNRLTPCKNKCFRQNLLTINFFG